jgi:putative transposase
MNENAQRPKFDALPLPTRRLVDRLIGKLDAYDKCVAQKGHDVARKEFRSVKGSIVTNAPLEWAEIDHTHLDLFVVDDETSRPVGRPYVTACIDKYTRCILGIYIGFTSPSFDSVVECLRDCILPKVNLKNEYPEIRSEWPAYGIPSHISFDNGLEFHCKSLESLCFSMNITPHYAPRKQAWFKGMIERFFGSLNGDFARGLPGYTFSNTFDKGDYDPAKDAVVPLSKMKTYLRKWVVDVYHQKFHSALHTSPFNMWSSSIKPEDIRLPDASIQLEAAMGLVDSRVLTPRGVEYEGLFYNSSELDDLRRREGAHLNVEIRVDQADIGSIYVLWPKTSRTYTVPALNSEYANGTSLWQHKQFKKWQKKNEPSNQNPYGWLKAREEISQMIEADLGRKRKKTRMGAARFKEHSARGAAKASATARELIPPKSPVSISQASASANVDKQNGADSYELLHPELRSPAAQRPKLKVVFRERHDRE